MRKTHTSEHEPACRPRRASRLPLVGAGLLLLVAAGPAYEAGLLVYAQWRSMAGTYWVPKTPLLDALGEWWRSADQSFRYRAHGWVNSGPWSPALAVPLAVGWAAAM